MLSASRSRSAARGTSLKVTVTLYRCSAPFCLSWAGSPSAVGKKPVEYHTDLSVSSDAISASCLAAFGAPQGGML